VEKLRKVPAAAKKVSIDSDSADMQGNFCFFPTERGGGGKTNETADDAGRKSEC